MEAIKPSSNNHTAKQASFPNKGAAASQIRLYRSPKTRSHGRVTNYSQNNRKEVRKIEPERENSQARVRRQVKPCNSRVRLFPHRLWGLS